MLLNPHIIEHVNLV